MAFNAQGVWIDENEDVASQLNAITSQNSDYIRQARQSGMQVANRRGLLNSSMAAGASEGAAIERAAPLALANAQIKAQRNLTALDSRFQMDRLKTQIGSTEKMQGLDIKSREKLAANEIAAQERMLGRQLTSTEKLAAEQRALDKWQTQAQIGSTEKIAGQEIKSREGMLGLELKSRQTLQTQQLQAERDMQALDLASRTDLLKRQLSSTELQQLRDITSRQGMLTQELDAQFRNLAFSTGAEKDRLQTQLAGELERAKLLANTELTRTGMEAEARLQQVAAQGNVDINLQELRNLNDQQKTTLAAFVDFNNQYSTALNNLYANKDMPQPARDAAIKMFTELRKANIDYSKLVFGTTLDWGTAPTPTPTAPGASPTVPGTILGPQPAAGLPGGAGPTSPAGSYTGGGSANYVPVGSAASGLGRGGLLNNYPRIA